MPLCNATDVNPAELEVRQKLGLVDRLESVHRFQLDHKLVTDDNVHKEVAAQGGTFVNDRQFDLVAMIDAA